MNYYDLDEDIKQTDGMNIAKKMERRISYD